MFHKVDWSPPERMLLAGGLGLTLLGLASGEWFALAVSHTLNSELALVWSTATAHAAAGDLAGLDRALHRLLEIAALRARSMSAHAHVGGYGLAVILSALFVRELRGTAAASLRRLEVLLILAGATLHCLVICVPGSHPRLDASGGAAAAVLLCAGTGLFVFRQLRHGTQGLPAASRDRIASTMSAESRLFALSLVLVFLGLLFGLYLAWWHNTYEQPALEQAFTELFQDLKSRSLAQANSALAAYKDIQVRMDITAAAHSHAVSLGMLLAAVSVALPASSLSATVRRLVRVLATTGSFLLPLFVYLAPRHHFPFALLADGAGALTALAILLVLIGLLRPDRHGETDS